MYINNNVFTASYDFGPKNEQINQKNRFVDLFESLIIRPFKYFVYPWRFFF